MKLLALFLVATVAAIQAHHADWHTFKRMHGKTFANPSLEATRRATYTQTLTRIDQHNKQFAQGKASFNLGVNRYADMPHEEFVRTMNGYRQPSGGLRQPTVLQSPAINLKALPTAVDWRSMGYTTPVKDQGQCGSCWAFSATGALEGQWFRKTGKLVPLSEQNLVDCAGSAYTCYACNGGWMNGAFTYIKNNGGINTAAYYPYRAIKGTCKYSKSFIGATDTGFVSLPSGSEAALQNAIATVGPVAIAIDASRPSFQLYKSGVYYDAACSSTNLNHGVLAVGYGTDPVGGDYWLVKNSWGTSWGEQGYIKIARNRNNHCGVATVASYPTV